jgi:phosphoglycerate kinase
MKKICFVRFAPDCVGPVAEGEAAKMGANEVLLLENLRFHPEEEANDKNFSKQLAKLADLYVNDAFGTAHRAHASTAGVTKFVKKAATGLLMEKELKYMGQVLSNPQRPFVAILGGVKVSDKIGVIKNMLTKVDALLIGGAMAYTFLKAQGKRVGNSKVEDDKVILAKQLMAESQANNIKFLLPVDHVIAEKISDEAEMIATIEGNQPIPEGMMALDIGPETVEMFADIIGTAKTIVWNGPMGVFELAPFSEGTVGIAQAVASNKDATSVVGGGDSVAAVHAAGVADKITHISTGGGASLEFLEGKKLPGIEALTEKS